MLTDVHAAARDLLTRAPALASALQRAGDVRRSRAPRWRLPELAGRLVELSTWRGGAALTLAGRLVHEAQCAGEPAVWVGGRASSFFPPDFDALGIDLDALPVVRAPRADDLPRAADRLARSGAFGLIVLDLGARHELTVALHSRLAAAAQVHDTAIVCLTEKPPQAASLGAMVSLRVHALVRRERAEGWFACEAEALKDKRHPPGWRDREVCRGPLGLR